MEPNELCTEPIGFARGGAVPDRDQFHPMISGKSRQLAITRPNDAVAHADRLSWSPQLARSR